MELRGTSCCGLREVVGLDGLSPYEALKQIGRKGWFERRAGFVLYVFSKNLTNGKEFREYIEKNKLGTITETDAVSGKIVGVWGVELAAYRAWYAENGLFIKVGDAVSGTTFTEQYYNFPITGRTVVLESDGERIGINFGRGLMHFNASALEFISRPEVI